MDPAKISIWIILLVAVIFVGWRVYVTTVKHDTSNHSYCSTCGGLMIYANYDILDNKIAVYWQCQHLKSLHNSHSPDVTWHDSEFVKELRREPRYSTKNGRRLP